MRILRLFPIALAAGLTASAAVAADTPDPALPLYCLDAKGSVLRVPNATFGEIVASYTKLTHWGYTVEPASSPTDLRVVFASSPDQADRDSATFAIDLYDDGMVVKGIDYRFEGETEHTPPGATCLRLISLTAVSRPTKP